MLKSFIAKKGTGSIRHLGGEMNRIGRRENWSGKGRRNRGENVGRGEKMECCGNREISGYKVILCCCFLTCVILWDGGMGNLTNTAISSDLLGLPWADNRESMDYQI